MQATPDYLPAILWVLLSTFIWTIVFAAGKFSDGAIGVFQLTLFRYLGGLAVIFVMIKFKGGLKHHRSKQTGSHFVRALTGCGGAIAITWASANMPLIDATAIGMLYGVLGVLLGMIFLKEIVTKQHWMAIAVTVFGVFIVMAGKGAFQSDIVLLPALAALLGAIFFAIEGLFISLLGRSEKALTVMLYVTVFGILLMIVPASLEWQPVCIKTLLLCLLLGPLGLAGQYCTIRGYRSAPLSIVAPVDYSWLIFSAILGLVIFKEMPSLSTLIGSATIIMGGLLLTRSKTQSKQTQ
ncbi:MAG: DMT family transporter [Pseudomonadota bacterium]